MVSSCVVWTSSIILVASLLLSTMYFLAGMPFLPLLFQLITHLKMFSRTPAPGIGLRSMEAYSLSKFFEKIPGDVPTTAQGVREGLAGIEYLFVARAPLGYTQSCPRTHKNVAQEIWIPIQGREKDDPLRIVQIDWDSENFEKNKGSLGVLLYFHGGGYVAGVPDLYTPFLARLSRRTGARVLAIDYRLAPENPPPAAVDDLFETYKYVLNELQIPPERIAFGGDSAGGGLVVGTLQRIIAQGLQPPAAAFAVSPWVDISGELSKKSYEENAEIDKVIPPASLTSLKNIVMSTAPEGADPKDPLYSFIYGNFVGFPPIFVTASKTETIWAEGMELVRRINLAGDGPAELYLRTGLPHVWVTSCLPEGVEDTAVISFWLLSRWREAQEK